MTRLALITGGHSGIGLGIAQALVDAGWHIAIAALPPAEDPTVKAAVAHFGKQAHYYPYDLRDIDQIEALLSAIDSTQGRIDCLVSNAGVSAKVRGDMLNVLPDNWDAVLDVNLRGTFFLAQAVARQMHAQPSGTYRSLVFVTSVSAGMVSVARAEYCVSKAGASMVAQLFATRLAPDGIGVFEIRPGIIETAMTSGAKDIYSERIASGLVPAGRWGQPEDIGATVLPLVEGHMQFATGATIAVDGGLSVPRL